MNHAIAWFARNSVAANLLMIVILGGGLLTISRLKVEIFPELSSEVISVSVVYPGAAPEEVEEGVCMRIEQALQGLTGVERVTATASENVGSVNVELVPGTDLQELRDDVKARVDAIDTFPEETEKPIVTDVTIRRQVIIVSISGKTDEATLKHLGEQVRDEISTIPGITQAELANARPYEMSIAVSETALRRFGLTFDEVARAVRRSSLDLPGGSLKTEGGEILLRTKGQAYRGPDFEAVVLRTRPDGTHLTLGQVAAVVDGFEETDQSARFDEDPAVQVLVFRVGDQNALDIAEKVKAYVAEAEARMPEGIQLTTWADFSLVLRSRLDLLIRNGRAGFCLVFLILALFLRLRLAFWVALGIPISFLGAIWTMPSMEASINLISLFAFIVVLGIVVDDAIIVGENIYRHFQQGKDRLRAAIEGTQQVSVPVIFAVLTSVAAFSPLLTVPGNTGKIMKLIPVIVIAALAFSLIESLFILPAHLAHAKMNGKKRGSWPVGRAWNRLQDRFASRMRRFTDTVYRPALELALTWRYVTVASGISTLLLTVGIVGGGWIKFTFFPQVEADYVVSLLTMPRGTPAEATARALRELEKAALILEKEIEDKAGEEVFRHMMTSIAEQPYRASQRANAGSAATFTGAHLGEVMIELTPSERREISSPEIARRWRELTGPIPDALELTVTASLFSAGAPIHIQLSGPDNRELQEVAKKLKTRLAEYPGVIEIADSFRPGKQEVKLSLTRTAEILGLTLSDLARQVRQAFYGEEAQRVQRGRHDVKVMVRYPAHERRSLGNLEEMRIRTPDGGEVPFSVAARAELGRGYASIRRADRQRIIAVTADVDENVANANEVLSSLTGSVLPNVLADHPRVRYTLEGEQREQREVLSGLLKSFMLALPMIYVLLAIPFKSYIQPLIIMAAIPFGLVGAVWGHIIMGMNLTILSMFGLVALTGVVVNDSLVMVDFINRSRSEGAALQVAIREAGAARFRPILLTSFTTFAGLTPILLEKSMQAQFLIPMAISLGFGVLLSTFITLGLVPVSYAILEDLRALVARIPERLKALVRKWRKQPRFQT